METQQSKDMARALVFVTKGNNKTVRYILTKEDYLTLLQAVEYEGEPRDGVAWTLLQRFAFLYPNFRSLASFIRAYAQPINPLWFPNGRKHLEWMRSLARNNKPGEAVAESKRAQQRELNALTPVEKISSTTKDVVDTVFSIGVSPVPGAVHYRAPTLVTKTVEEAKKARDEFGQSHYLAKPIDYGNIVKSNWFWTTSNSASFRLQTVLAEISTVGQVIFLLLCAGSLGSLLYTSWKNYNG